MLLAIRTVSFKKRRGFTLSELGIVLIILAFLASMGFLAWNVYLDKARRTGAATDVDQLAKACLVYEMDSLNGKPPADLGQLVTGLSAANTIDGIERKSYIVRDGWTATASSIKDPWGTAYTYSQTNRTISYNLPDGTTKTKTF